MRGKTEVVKGLLCLPTVNKIRVYGDLQIIAFPNYILHWLPTSEKLVKLKLSLHLNQLTHFNAYRSSCLMFDCSPEVSEAEGDTTAKTHL